MWLLYQLALALTLSVAGPLLLLRRGNHYLSTLSGRLGGHRGKVCRDGLWIHAVSVGETLVAGTLARALPGPPSLLFTTVTPTGQERARALAADPVFAGRASAAYLPFDLGLPIRRFLRRFSPRALVLVEGDYWPLVLHRVRQRGLRVAVVNGRMSDRSFRRLTRVRPLARWLLTRVDRFGVQSPEDRDKLLALGVDEERVTVTGNLKYESPAPKRNPELEASLRRLAGERPILLAGSTMSGEEEQVLDAFAALGGGDKALLLLAPRHPERWGEVARLLERRGLPTAWRSRLAERAVGQPPPDVVLLDSLGELAGLYALGAGAFVGGTLVPTGGHNPLEPARFAVPVAVGPSLHNFRDMAEQFDRAEAWARVRSAEALARVWAGWLADPDARRELGERGARLVESNRGSLARTLKLLEPLLAELPPGSRPSESGDPP